MAGETHTRVDTSEWTQLDVKLETWLKKNQLIFLDLLAENKCMEYLVLGLYSMKKT